MVKKGGVLMKLNKRGISPLIATVLIIGFTVALAAVILIWGQSFTRGIQSSTEETTNIQLMCAQDVVFDITAACYCETADRIKMTVKNDGSVDIANLTARVYKGATDVSTVTEYVDPDTGVADSNEALNKYAIKTYGIDSSAFGSRDEVNQLDLIPVIVVEGIPEPITCSNTINKYLDVNGIDKLAKCSGASVC